MSIPDAAIEAAAEAVLKYDYGPRMEDADEYVRGGYRHAMSLAIEAAMPAIREAIAQEIEASVSTIWQREGNIDAAWCSGMDRAARIVRGGAA